MTIKRFFITIAASVSALLLPLSGFSADYKLNVQNFKELRVVDGIAVDYCCHPDSAGWAVFTCDPDMASQIMFNNNKERLSVQTASEDGRIVEGTPRVRVYSSALCMVENSGDSTVVVHNLVPIQTFKAKLIGNGSIYVHGIHANSVEAGIVTGNGNIAIDGKAQKAKYHNVGTGSISARNLDAAQVKCIIISNGKIECSASKKLNIVGMGSGRVEYHGNPESVSNSSIGVKAINADKTEVEP